MSIPPGANAPLRIGHQDRQAACAALDAHLEAGRLDAEEYGERYAIATMARTRPELDELFLDLPAPHATRSEPVSMTKRAAGSASDWQRYLPTSGLGRAAAVVALVTAVCLLVPVLATGAVIWFVLIPLLTGRGCHGRRRHHSWSTAPGAVSTPAARRVA